jgi:hypothetical protein
VFVPGKPLQPSLMFAGEARSLPKSGTPETAKKGFVVIGPGVGVIKHCLCHCDG